MPKDMMQYRGELARIEGSTYTELFQIKPTPNNWFLCSVDFQGVTETTVNSFYYKIHISSFGTPQQVKAKVENIGENTQPVKFLYKKNEDNSVSVCVQRIDMFINISIPVKDLRNSISENYIITNKALTNIDGYVLIN